MIDTEFRAVDRFEEPGFSELQRQVFAGLEQQSRQLAEVLASEAASRASSPGTEDGTSLRIGAFRNGELIGWTYGWCEREHHFYMAHSGVIDAARRQGVYSQLVRLVIEHAQSRGYTSITSRHVTVNNSVIIAKLQLSFRVSGFAYSEVYGPLVHLTYLVGEPRRQFYRARAAPLRPPTVT